jgi:hypothetical protein
MQLAHLNARDQMLPGQALRLRLRCQPQHQRPSSVVPTGVPFSLRPNYSRILGRRTPGWNFGYLDWKQPVQRSAANQKAPGRLGWKILSIWAFELKQRQGPVEELHVHGAAKLRSVELFTETGGLALCTEAAGFCHDCVR